MRRTRISHNRIQFQYANTTTYVEFADTPVNIPLCKRCSPYFSIPHISCYIAWYFQVCPTSLHPRLSPKSLTTGGAVLDVDGRTFVFHHPCYRTSLWSHNAKLGIIVCQPQSGHIENNTYLCAIWKCRYYSMYNTVNFRSCCSYTINSSTLQHKTNAKTHTDRWYMHIMEIHTYQPPAKDCFSALLHPEWL